MRKRDIKEFFSRCKTKTNQKIEKDREKKRL